MLGGVGNLGFRISSNLSGTNQYFLLIPSCLVAVLISSSQRKAGETEAKQVHGQHHPVRCLQSWGGRKVPRALRLPGVAASSPLLWEWHQVAVWAGREGCCRAGGGHAAGFVLLGWEMLVSCECLGDSQGAPLVLYPKRLCK